MPRPPEKATRRLAKAQKLGELQAEEEMRQKHLNDFSLKNLGISLREHLGKMLDTMTMRDIIDLVAAVGLTPFVQNALQELAGVVNATTSIISDVFTYGVPGLGVWIASEFGGFFKSLVPASPETPTSTPESQQTQIVNWLLAFAISWCIVKWGDKMLSAGLGSLTSIVGMIGIAAS